MLDHFNKDMFLILNHKVVQSVSLNYISLYVIIKPSIVKIKYMNYLNLSSTARIQKGILLLLAPSPFSSNQSSSLSTTHMIRTSIRNSKGRGIIEK